MKDVVDVNISLYMVEFFIDGWGLIHVSMEMYLNCLIDCVLQSLKGAHTTLIRKFCQQSNASAVSGKT